jgi:hypothetical protein
MKSRNSGAMFLMALIFIATSATILSKRAGAQDDGWQIVSASYGYRNQRMDVTDILKDQIAHGGINGVVAVNNDTMGGDPAKGKDKSLHIVARNRNHEERGFDYNEGGFIDVRLFAVRRENRDDRPPAYTDQDRDRDHDRDRDRFRDEGYRLQIMGAYYGVQGRTVNVTDLLRNRVRDGALNLVVTNGALGGDPAQGYDKILIVVYRTQGNETATAVAEGNTLSIP